LSGDLVKKVDGIKSEDIYTKNAFDSCAWPTPFDVIGFNNPAPSDAECAEMVSALPTLPPLLDERAE
jgi:hypothetical protein